jgi:menaquinone-specific isochorismate synthase
VTRATPVIGTPGPDQFRAVTVRLAIGRALDPVALAGDDGYLFAGPFVTLAARGVAAVLPLPGGLNDAAGLRRAQQWLAAVSCRDDVGVPGTGVVAHGALPFGRAEAGRLVVPALTYGRDDQGNEWATVVGPAADLVGEPDAAALAQQLMTRSATAGAGTSVLHGENLRELVAIPPPEDYEEAVEIALRAIGSGSLSKVVLARRVDLTFDAPVPVVPVLRRLHQREPGSTAFSHPVLGGQFIGASPELLVSRRGAAVRCHPLAGTIPLTGDEAADRAAEERLLRSAKNRVEHELVVDEIVGALRALGAEVAQPPAPGIVRLRSVAHLATQLSAHLAPAEGTSGALELVAALHPTAAVGGVPRDEALASIAALEAVPREHWAAPVGWVDGSGDGDWVIGIRSATLAGPVAQLWAGAGIVTGSEPALELAETTAKLAPLADALLEDESLAVLTAGTLAGGTQPVG